jgi:hypothetical protein
MILPKSILIYTMNKLVLFKNKLVAFLSLLPAIFFLGACEKSQQIGFGLTNQEEVEVYYTDTLTVEASTTLRDSISTNNSSLILVGKHQDTELSFGKISTKAFFQVAADTLLLNDKDIAVADSLVLNLSYGYAHPTIPTVPQTIHLYPLSDDFAADKVYYSHNTLGIDMDSKLADIQVHPDSITQRARVSYTLSKTEKGNALMLALFDLAKNNTTVKTFLETYKGFALLPDDDNQSVVGFNVSNLTNFTLYYHSNNESKTRYAIVFRSDFGRNFNHIETNRQGTSLENVALAQLIPSAQTNSFTYIQSGAGLVTKLDFPSLDNLKKLGNVVINRAELVIKPKLESTSTYTPPILTLLRADETNKLLKSSSGALLFAVSEANSAFNLGFNTRNQEYRTDITSHLQRVFSELDPHKGLILMSMIPVSGSLPIYDGTTLNRVIISNDKNSEFRTRLRIFYTVFNE